MYQFGIASMQYGGQEFGTMQNVSVDISFDSAKLYAGGSYFPVDVRAHTGSITGTAEFAEINAMEFEKLLGGSRSGDTITLNNTHRPNTYQLVITIATDGIGMILTFVKVRSTKLSLPFSRENHVIPSFDFECQANSSGLVATIDLGDIS